VEIIIHKLFVQIGLTSHGRNIGIIVKQGIATIIGTVLAAETRHRIIAIRSRAFPAGLSDLLGYTRDDKKNCNIILNE